MNQLSTEQIINEYPFLDEKTAQEPYVSDILFEITSKQRDNLQNSALPLATLEYLKTSNNIKVPYTGSRNKNIEYLVEILTTRFPNVIKPIISFSFKLDPAQKSIKITETQELTIALRDSALEQILNNRNQNSLKSLLKLLKRYRVFNLSKLLKSCKHKKQLSDVIKQGLGSQIFTFKRYATDKNFVEWSEDFCFHADNYSTVISAIDLTNLQKIVSNYKDLINRRLNKFGILNSSFSDYRDSKLDYLFNILLDDLASTLTERDLIEVKNIKSLRTCLLKVNKILDPVQTNSEDISKYIIQNEIATKQELINTLAKIDEDILNRWLESEDPQKKKIEIINNPNGNFLIFGPAVPIRFKDYVQKVMFNSEELQNYSYSEKQNLLKKIDQFYSVAKHILAHNKNAQNLFKLSDAKMKEFIDLLNEYEQYKNRFNNVQQNSPQNKKFSKKKKESLFSRIKRKLHSIFSPHSAKGTVTNSKNTGSPMQRKILTKDSKIIIKKISSKKDSILALSDYLELTHENDQIVDNIIDELRSNNIRLVVPVYNAKEALYPKRSQKLLISNVEYLLLPTSAIVSSERIYSFVNSLVGYKLKGETIPSKGLTAIEKYLLTVYRQKRNSMMNR